MAPPAVLKHRFQNSLDMMAARSMCSFDRAVQSGTGNAWCIMDSPTLGKMSSGLRSGDISLKLEESTMASGSGLASQSISVAPLNIKKKVKKIRRRGFVSGVHLELPPSPRPSPSPPQTAITFTAEWDLSQNTFVFTPFDSSYPSSALSPQFARSPIPVNVDEDAYPSPALSTPSIYSQPSTSPHHPGLPVIQTAWSEKQDVTNSIASASSEAPDSSNSSPCTPVSAIFDRQSLYSHGRNLSQSTTASSVVDFLIDCSPISPTTASRHEALHAFKKELDRSAPVVKADDPKVDGECYEVMDRDLLLAPMDVFEQMLWDSTETEPQVIRRQTSARAVKASSVARRSVPDVPRSVEPNKSRFSACSSQHSAIEPDTYVPASSSLRQQLRMQISKARFGAVVLKR